jgi:hypothetical protein
MILIDLQNDFLYNPKREMNKITAASIADG